MIKRDNCKLIKTSFSICELDEGRIDIVKFYDDETTGDWTLINYWFTTDKIEYYTSFDDFRLREPRRARPKEKKYIYDLWSIYLKYRDELDF